jgi:very-short-patch-repair endonuclease
MTRPADPERTSFSRKLRRESTDVEMKLWRAIRNRQLDGHMFVRQGSAGPYFADFVCREAKLVVELDGSQHADSVHDLVRDAYLRGQGFRILRFWNSEILENLDGVSTTIHAALSEQAPHPAR